MTIHFARQNFSFVISSSFVIRFTAAIALSMASAASLMAETHSALDLVLPTDNDALFSGDGAAFYQYVDRDSNGVKSKPWEGGQYGLVRDLKETAAGAVYTRFHEGIDIKPMPRDAGEQPLDEVRAIADG